jgi:GTP cyclohydrolase III
VAPKQTKIFLNAGCSQRVVDFINREFPQLECKFHYFDDFSVLTVPGNMPNMELQALITRIKNIYPVEIQTEIEPANKSKPQ